MKQFIPLTISFLLLQTCFAPPVTKNKEKEHDNEEVAGLEDYMEYHRYLREVVNALESDPQFRQKLEKADEQDIRSGKIAEELEFVSHHVRSRLDEIKRVELNRLKELTEKKRRLQENIDLEDPSHRHLDHSNPHTFEIDDLKKLIAKTTADLVEADRKRKEEFKQYELQKEYDKQLKLNQTNGTEREKLEKEFREQEEKHKKHEKLHEPGHKAQLEEVWQEQDQMQQEFDPKTFFMLHDIDSNGLWDQDEVKALFVKELEKMYAAGEPEDDMRERAEEMERMRESVFKEVDLNRDGFIDYDEFLAQTKRNDFQQDHGWQGLDEQRPYSDQELEEYIRQHQMSNQIPHGYPPQYPGHVPQPVYQVPPGHYPNGVPINPGPVPPQQYHPGQLPQQHPQQPQVQLNSREMYPPQHQVPNQRLQAQQQPYQGQGHYQQQPQVVNQHHQVPVQQQQQVPLQQQQQQVPLQQQQQHVPVQQQQQLPIQQQQAQIPAHQQQQQQQVPVEQQHQQPVQGQENLQQGAPLHQKDQTFNKPEYPQVNKV